jgi:hypothetical protein
LRGSFSYDVVLVWFIVIHLPPGFVITLKL